MPSFDTSEGSKAMLPTPIVQADRNLAKDWGADLTPKKSFHVSSFKANDLRTKAFTYYNSSSSGKELDKESEATE